MDPRDEPVMSAKHLHQIIYTHWALDTTTYADERQCVQVAAGLLLASFTQCRPASPFHTTRKAFTDDSKDDFECLHEPGLDTSYTASDPDPDSDSDSGPTDDCDADSDSDLSLDDDSGRTGSLRYRDIDFLVLRPKSPGDSDIRLAEGISSANSGYH